MAVIAPTPVDALPTAPDPNDRPTFDARAYPYQVALSGAYRTQMNALAANVNNNAGEASLASTAAVTAAASASTAASQAMAAANFKGVWPDLTGPLNKPACVKNDGRFWALRVNLADVALSEPSDANTDWVSLDAGLTPSQRITGDTVAVPGVCYLFDAGCKLTLAAIYAKGQYQGYRAGEGVTDWSVDFGAHKFRKRDVGLVLGDVPLCEVDMFYQDADWGMR